MERLGYNVTLEEAYQHVKERSFGLWKISGNYMNGEVFVSGKNVETLVFMGKSIFLVGLSVEKEGFNILGSGVDFIDIWPSVKKQYPQLFQEGMKGELCLIP